MCCIRIGLTGGIAAGKSTVAARLRELGAYVIDYDVLAAAVVAPGSEGMRQIVRAFGVRAMREDGTLNRAWMAEHIFGVAADRDARDRLDAIEHPLIYELAKRKDREFRCDSSRRTHGPDGVRVDGCRVIVHDVPLLAEVIDVIPFAFEHIVTVEAPESVRIERMMHARAMSRAQAEDRIRHQTNRENRLKIADIVIDATQPIERMFETVDTLYDQWTARS